MTHEDNSVANEFSQVSDEELMVRYQKGQESAFEELFSRYEKRVYGYLSIRGASPELIDDAFQETFRKLHKNLHKYDPELPFAPWLFTICRNAFLDCIRKQTRVVEREVPMKDLPEVDISDAPEVELPDLGSLPENQRRALEGRYLRDQTFEQIADALKTSPMNARKLISRALKRLRKTSGLT